MKSTFRGCGGKMELEFFCALLGVFDWKWFVSTMAHFCFGLRRFAIKSRKLLQSHSNLTFLC